MNRYIIVAIIAVLFLGAGGYLYFNSQKGTSSTSQGHMMEDTSGKPIAQSHRSYEIEVTSQPVSIEPKKPATFRYKIKNDKGEILKNYEIAHEKIMHFITIRKDLANFQHLHPEFNKATGEFTVVVTFPDDGPYRLFPDFTPGEENPQKLPVTVYHDIDVGNSSKYYAQSVVPDTETRKKYDPYQITFSVPKGVKAQQEFTYTLSVEKNGQSVTNLEKYLGALGHSVILRDGTLDFIHTHALEADSQGDAAQGHSMNAMQKEPTTGSGPDIKFATTFPEPGVYKIFTQFQHEGKVQTVDYIVKVN